MSSKSSHTKLISYQPFATEFSTYRESTVSKRDSHRECGLPCTCMVSVKVWGEYGAYDVAERDSISLKDYLLKSPCQ